jgi:hypothetical protein
VDPRIAVAVPCLGVQSFRWALAHNDWQAHIGTIQPAFDMIAKDAGKATPDAAFVKIFYNRVVPEMLPLIAPRPLLVIGSDSEKNCPLPVVMEWVNTAQAVYRADHVADHFRVIIQKNTGHQVLPDSERAAIDWLVNWLKA